MDTLGGNRVRPMTVRLLIVIVAGVVLALLGGPGMAPRHAHACSLVGFGSQLLPFAIESSSVVAVGRLVDPKRDVITLEVEEGLKGATAGQRLTVNNATLGLGADCSVYLEPRGRGFALPEGARVLAFLEPNDLTSLADFRSALHGFGILTLDGEYIQAEGASVARFSEVREAIRRLQAEPLDLNLETEGPCNASIYITDDAILRRNVRMSSLIAIGTYRSTGDGVAEFDVQEVLRGETGGNKTLELNAHYFFQDGTCRATMETASASYPSGFQSLVFLRPDDYGVTDWRGAVWGQGILAIVGDDLQRPPGLPTLKEVRAAAGQPNATPGSAAKTRDDRWLPVALVVAAGLCTAAVGYVIVRRRQS